jgi:predicted deacetylase
MDRTPRRPPASAVATGRPERWLVVSIHDVMPDYTDEIRLLLAHLDALDVRPRVLKVVPNAGGCGPIAATSPLARLLRDERRAGSEVVLHGYTHQVSGPFRGAWPVRCRARLFVADAGEFLTLDDAQMAARLAAGQRALAALDIAPAGFCAPGWLAPRTILAALRRQDFRYYVGMNALYDLRADRRRWLPWAGYMGGGAWHERLVYLGGAVQLAVSPAAPAVKVFLHPQHIRESEDYVRVLRLLARLVRERQPITYGRLLDLYT